MFSWSGMIFFFFFSEVVYSGREECLCLHLVGLAPSLSSLVRESEKENTRGGKIKKKRGNETEIPFILFFFLFLSFFLSFS